MPGEVVTLACSGCRATLSENERGYTVHPEPFCHAWITGEVHFIQVSDVTFPADPHPAGGLDTWDF